MSGPARCSTPRQLDDAVACGAKFLVSPGATPGLLAAAKDSPVPFLPGVATAGEAMTLAEAGFAVLKFFPAEPAGGVAYLKALVGAAARHPLLSDRRDHAQATRRATSRFRTSSASAARGWRRPTRSRGDWDAS